MRNEAQSRSVAQVRLAAGPGHLEAIAAQRQGTADVAISGALLTVEMLGLALLLVGGWLGGELVDRLGVGVDENAHLNAPNSLLHSSPARHDARRAAQP